MNLMCDNKLDRAPEVQDKNNNCLGYWLCHSGDQCILSGVSIADVNMSSLCDGKLDCLDWSDESFIECVKVINFCYLV